MKFKITETFGIFYIGMLILKTCSLDIFKNPLNYKYEWIQKIFYCLNKSIKGFNKKNWLANNSTLKLRYVIKIKTKSILHVKQHLSSFAN